MSFHLAGGGGAGSYNYMQPPKTVPVSVHFALGSHEGHFVSAFLLFQPGLKDRGGAGNVKLLDSDRSAWS